VSNKQYTRSQVIDNALRQLSRNHSNTANFDRIQGHVQAQRDTGHIRWFVATRTIDGDISYRLEHFDFRSYRQGRKQLDQLFEKVKKYYSVNGQSPAVYYGAGCANARGKGERGVSQVNAQMYACMHAMTTKSTNEHRTLRSCPYCRNAEVEAVPRTKSRRMRCTNLGCAAFQGNIDRLGRCDEERDASWQSRTRQ